MRRAKETQSSQQLINNVVNGVVDLSNKVNNIDSLTKISVNPYVFNLPLIDAKESIKNFKAYCDDYNNGLATKYKEIKRHNSLVR